MSRVWSMMDVGKRAMMNSQTGLQTVSHNIANKDTEGYSRQRIEQKAKEPIGHGNLRIGTGANVTNVTRTNNPFIEKQLEQERSQLGEASGKADTLMRVEQIYNEQQNKGLNKFMGEFFNAFRELSNSPESVAIRSMVKESGDFMAKDFKRVTEQLEAVQEEADFKVHVLVEQVNAITKEISELNDKVRNIEINGRTANDERDRRENLIKELGETINIKYAEGDNGSLTVTAGNNAILVSGGTNVDLIVSKGPKDKHAGEGRARVFYKSVKHGTPIDVTQQLKGGAMGGVLDVRDRFVEEIKADMDEMAYSFAKNVNAIHMAGYDKEGNQGVAFFEPIGDKVGAAAKLKVSDSIMNNPGRIAAGAVPNAPGDNRIANMISALQYDQTMGDGQSTYNDFYGNIVGRVGVTTARSNSEVESQKGIVDQLKNIRESISGVSIDEETTKMIEYQKSYDASARLIRTADEMMDTVLNLKRY